LNESWCKNVSDFFYTVFRMEDEVRKVLAEASGDLNESDSDSEKDFHDASHLADNVLTRPSDWRPSRNTSGRLDVIFRTCSIGEEKVFVCKCSSYNHITYFITHCSSSWFYS